MSVPVPMHDDEVEIDEETVRALVAGQFPHLAHQPLRIVEPWGTDNAIWRLGDDLVLRFPRIHWAVRQPEKEATWLPRLAPHLTVAVPEPVAVGEPGHGYPHRWGLNRWLPGEPAVLERMDDAVRFATALAGTVLELRSASAHDAPPAHGRARPLEAYDADTRAAIGRAGGLIDVDAALAVWEEGLAAPPHDGPPVWVHGDLEGNCLLTGGRLSGIVDWGSACAGDPAVDVQVVWSPLFTPASRKVFLDLVGADDATIARSRAAAANQACAALPYYLDTDGLIVERSWHKLRELGVRPSRTGGHRRRRGRAR